MKGKKPLVLVIDDDLDLREVLEVVLQDNNLDMVSASNGQEALNYLLNSDRIPDVILLDLMMPIMDGSTFRKHQLEHPRLLRIPTIVMSASDHLKNGHGPMYYLAKPFDVCVLIQKIWLAIQR